MRAFAARYQGAAIATNRTSPSGWTKGRRMRPHLDPIAAAARAGERDHEHGGALDEHPCPERGVEDQRPAEPRPPRRAPGLEHGGARERRREDEPRFGHHEVGLRDEGRHRRERERPGASPCARVRVVRAGQAAHDARRHEQRAQPREEPRHVRHDVGDPEGGVRRRERPVRERRLLEVRRGVERRHDDVARRVHLPPDLRVAGLRAGQEAQVRRERQQRRGEHDPEDVREPARAALRAPRRDHAALSGSVAASASRRATCSSGRVPSWANEIPTTARVAPSASTSGRATAARPST